MNESLQILKELSISKILAIAGILLAIVLAIFLVTTKIDSGDYTILYSDLSPADSQGIIAELESQNIEYEVRAGGAQIAVPDKVVHTLRIKLATQGIPSKGSIVGYEIFDKSESLGVSSFVQNVNLVRALEGELIRTISTFKGISDARVHLVMPKRELFLESKQEPSASVMIKMKGGQKLSKEEINSIAYFVASAVPGLELNQITIVDSHGRSLKLATDEQDQMVNTSNAEEYKVSVENRMRSTVEQLLSKSLGEGKVHVQVAADINFDKIITNSEIYDPDGQVVRSVQSSEQKSTSSEAGGNVSVANNLPNANKNAAEGGGGSRNSKTDEVTNYEISKTIKNHISETGSISKLSIAVLVDGIYTQDDEGKSAYQPRSEEELKKLTTLVKSAVGFDEKRGDIVEIVNMEFVKEGVFAEENKMTEIIKEQLPGIIQSLIIGMVVILIILLVIKPIMTRAFNASEIPDDEVREAEALATGADPAMIAARKAAGGGAHFGSGGDAASVSFGDNDDDAHPTIKIDQRFKSNTLKSIDDIVDKSPQETAFIIKNWMGKDH